MVLQDQEFFHYFLETGKDLSSHQVIEQLSHQVIEQPSSGCSLIDGQRYHYGNARSTGQDTTLLHQDLLFQIHSLIILQSFRSFQETQ
jgi:hypothetical protein